MSKQEYTEEEVVEIKDRILEALEMVIDSKLGIDIVDLDPVYETCSEQNGHTEIGMTLTTMRYPLTNLLTDRIHSMMHEIPEVTNTEVKLIWYPTQTVDEMGRYTRTTLGIR